jgi:hypothetical protein
MAETVYNASNHTAVVRCPDCQRTKTVDLSAYQEVKKALRFKFKCPCGRITTSILEKRRGFRKEINLPGTYTHYVEGRPKDKGALTVKDISINGMKLMIPSSTSFAIGDMLRVSFNLDDAQHSQIQKKVVVRTIHPPFIGVEIAPTETSDKTLGFYLRA